MEYTTFKTCKIIRHQLLLRAGECLVYTNWSDEFSVSNVRRLNDLLEKNGINKVDPTDLSLEEMDELGFGWNDESSRLIPIWLFTFLCDSFNATCITGENVTSRSELNDDHRGGMLAYSVIPKK